AEPLAAPVLALAGLFREQIGDLLQRLVHLEGQPVAEGLEELLPSPDLAVLPALGPGHYGMVHPRLIREVALRDAAAAAHAAQKPRQLGPGVLEFEGIHDIYTELGDHLFRPFLVRCPKAPDGEITAIYRSILSFGALGHRTKRGEAAPLLS